MSARALCVAHDPMVIAPKLVSALNGRIGADIIVPSYQRLIETEYLPPSSPHWTDECSLAQASDLLDEPAETFDVPQILQPRRLLLRVF